MVASCVVRIVMGKHYLLHGLWCEGPYKMGTTVSVNYNVKI